MLRPVSGLKLTGSRLVVLRGNELLVYALASGQLVRHWTLQPGGYPAPSLEDAFGNFVTYIAGVAIHVVRLSDGRDVALRLDEQAGPVHSQLERTGLYYSYTRAYSADLGSIGFVLTSRLADAFG